MMTYTARRSSVFFIKDHAYQVVCSLHPNNCFFLIVHQIFFHISMDVVVSRVVSVIKVVCVNGSIVTYSIYHSNWPS